MDAILWVGKGLMEFWGVLRVESRRERTMRQCEIPSTDDRGNEESVCVIPK